MADRARARGRIPNEAWRGRLWKTTEYPPLSVDNGLWAAVTEIGDRGWNESESTPLHGMRIQLYEDEEHARAAAAASLARHPEKDARGRAVPLAPPVVQYAKKGLRPARMTLRAVSATDAGMCGGNTALARQSTGISWSAPARAGCVRDRRARRSTLRSAELLSTLQ